MQVDLTKLEVANPSKWDIIPIHNSDRATFKFCRRQWRFSSPSQQNLIPRTAVHGVRIPLWFGTGIHHALEHFYTPGLSEDPVVVFQAWFDLQWNGGLIDDSQLKEFVDREPMPVKNSEDFYKVKGLSELLPFPDEEQFMDLRELGMGMLEFYKEYAAKNDNFTVIATEHDFSVPIMTPEGKVMYAYDTRTMPEGWEPDFTLENAYGPLMREIQDAAEPMYKGQIEKQVHTRGRNDMIIQDNDTGQYGIQDHKTTSKIDDDYFRGLDLDEQCTSYLTFGEDEAAMYDLPYKKLDYITYQALFKGFPKPPTILKNGTPSLNRQEETTTAEMFEKCIQDLGIQIIFENDLKMQSYYTWLLEKGDERYIIRTDVRRNEAQKKNARLRLWAEATDMLNSPKLYPNPSKNYGCLNCIFRGPCIAMEDGSDYKMILEDAYVPNWDR